jgi:hypothetical protein
MITSFSTSPMDDSYSGYKTKTLKKNLFVLEFLFVAKVVIIHGGRFSQMWL